MEQHFKRLKDISTHTFTLNNYGLFTDAEAKISLKHNTNKSKSIILNRYGVKIVLIYLNMINLKQIVKLKKNKTMR